jgi:L-ascorbate metabolism protein UlaG (beta-lactamase superfamily)
MKIEYLGHSCFWFTDGSVTALIDPYDSTVGYKPPHRPAKYTIVTHDHWDHGHVNAVPGTTTVLRGSGTHGGGPHGGDGFSVRGILACHDNVGGVKRGLVNLMCFALDGVRVCHLSDLGHLLEPDQIAEIGAVDVLLVPIGGGDYTIDAEGAAKVVAQLNPRAVIPMHYMTAMTNRKDFPIDGLEPFLKKFRHSEQVRRGEIEFTPKTLPLQTTVYCLTPTR